MTYFTNIKVIKDDAGTSILECNNCGIKFQAEDPYYCPGCGLRINRFISEEDGNDD